MGVGLFLSEDLAFFGPEAEDVGVDVGSIGPAEGVGFYFQLCEVARFMQRLEDGAGQDGLQVQDRAETIGKVE